ncbi:pyruvate kinase [Simkania negevensis]|uniref:Pyruvate kinase n=1 Tax=Simkania negevensis TaxID=83561 RepID=A0ABS3ASH4_9BACT|nr:pyruvate kinase [Simkania negevensis]
MVRTKIICTIGPSTSSYEQIVRLIESGMNVARLNFSHGNHDSHYDTIEKIKKARETVSAPIAIMLDTKGPEIRIGTIVGGGFTVEAKQELILTSQDDHKDSSSIPIVPSSVLTTVQEGSTILFNDGYISSTVKKMENGTATVVIENRGALQSGKGVNIPNTRLNLPAMTEQDVDDILFGCHNDIDMIAASFIRSPEHVLAIKKLLEDEGYADISIISKIENSEGVKNFDSILQVSNGIMIARGDLGVELPLTRIPRLQKLLIRQSYLAGKPAITATHMLESMINNPRPTRAEASDVANAIYDGSSAVMLSGETAAGQYPIEAVETMKSIIEDAEIDFDYEGHFAKYAQETYHDIPSSVTIAAVKTSYSANAKAIFTLTHSGTTARLLSRLKPRMPIIALTPIKKVYYQLAINWGVIPLYSEICNAIEDSFDTICKLGLEHNLVEYGDLIILTAGTPFGISGTTNTIIVDNIGEVLVRAHEGIGERITAKASLVFSPEDKDEESYRDRLIVISKCTKAYMPLFKNCAGIILQNQANDHESERLVKAISIALNIPVLIRADGALATVKENQLITIDPDQSLLFEGFIK